MTTPQTDQTVNENAQEAQANPEQEIESSIKTTETTEAATSQPSEDSADVDYKQKFANSSKEAIRLHKEKQKLQEEVEYQKKVLQVSKDPNTLKLIADTDIATADRIAQEYGYSSYQEIISADSTAADTQTIDPKKAALEVYEQKEKEKEAQKIEEFEENYLIEREIVPGTDKYKKVMEIYNQYKPQTATQAKQLLEMADKYTEKETGEGHDYADAPQSFSSSAGRTGEIILTREDYEIMKEWNLTKEVYIESLKR